MILAVKTTKPQRDFTLIEIVMVPTIAGVVMAGADGSIIFSSDKRAEDWLKFIRLEKFQFENAF
jgi:hypothetical protein